MLDYVKSARRKEELTAHLNALKSGSKRLWLVDHLPERFMKLFLEEISKDGFKTGVAMGQRFVWRGKIERIERPIIYAVEEGKIIDLTDELSSIFDGVLESLENGQEYTNEKEYLTPSVIGYLLGFPLVYLIGPEFDECKNKLNNMDLLLYQYHYQSVQITSFTVPSDINLEIEPIQGLDLTVEHVNLPSVCL